MLEPVPACRRQRSKSPEWGREPAIELGHADALYHQRPTADALRIIEHWFERAAGFHYPSDGPSACKFLDDFLVWCRACSSYRTAAGLDFPGGLSEQPTHASKHLTRIMVLQLKKEFPDHFATLPMQTLMT